MNRLKPLVLSMGSYSTMYTLSDMCQQKLVTKRHEIDFNKTMRICTVGGIVIAPLVFTWLRIVEFMFPGRTIMAIVKKVIAEQVCLAPVAINSFYIGTSVLEGKEDILADSKEKFIQTYKIGLSFWPIVQTINFAFVPTDKKVFIVAGASFIWSNYLCYMKEKDS